MAGPSRPSPLLRSRSGSPGSGLPEYADFEEQSDREDELAEDESASGDETESDTVRHQVYSKEDQGAKGKGVATARASGQSASQERGTSWADLDLSIIVACVSPIGNWLTGGDHIKNLFLIILLIFYLHQLIEVPWSLYQSSRPRKTPNTRSTQKSSDPVAALAATELYRREFFFLFLTVLSPLLGALFLHHVLDALGGAESLSWFSTTLFVLATGIRPWTHLLTRLRERTHALHDAVHYPPSTPSPADEQLAHVTRRLNALERELKEVRARTAQSERLQDVCDDLSEAIGELERGSKRNERKADAGRLAVAARVTTLETALLQLEQNRKIDFEVLQKVHSQTPPFYITVYRRARCYVAPFLAGVCRAPKAIWALGTLDAHVDSPVDARANGAVHPVGILKYANGNGAPARPAREKGSPSLPTIPEVLLSDADADSEGTYVSDKEKDPLSSPPVLASAEGRRQPGRARSRSKGRNGPDRAVHEDPRLSVGQRRFKLVESIVLWPYRASVRILIMAVPPLRKILPAFLL